jgi:hypothetical protein
MIDNVVAALGLGLNLTDEEIADVLWLAVQMQQFGDGVIFEQGDRNEALEDSVSNRESPKQSAQPLRDADRDRQDENKKDEQNFEVHSKNAQGDDRSTRRSDELQLKIPDARSLQEPLELARSLRPLMRRVPSRVNTLLDEEATVRRIAEEKIWCPVLRPALEPWLDLALVIDDSASMLMWRHTIAELQHFLSSYGVFRDVRVWRLGTDKAEKVCIYAGATASDRNGSPRSPSELIEANGRGLVLVVSDCIAPIWRNGAIATALQIWSRSGMVAILQMLPDWLWARTALGRGVAAQFSALAAGIPNYQLTTTTVSTWYDIDLATSIKIPVVTLEPEKFTAWAEMLAGKGGAWSAGIVFEPELFAVPEVAIEFDGASELDAEDRVQSFRLTASPIARRLAGLLAAAPVISLPIVRILQSKVLTQSQPVHVAEVFLGGLLKPLSEITAKTNPNYVQYDFIEGVRDLLLESVPSSEIVNVVAEVSEYIAERLGISLEEFGAVIRNPRQVENTELISQTRPFALLTAQILKRLGGDYVRFAEEIEMTRNSQNSKYLNEEYVSSTKKRSVNRNRPMLFRLTEFGHSLVRESLKKFGSINNFCKTTRQPRQAFTKFNDGNGVTRETVEAIFDALEIPNWCDDFDKIVELVPDAFINIKNNKTRNRLMLFRLTEFGHSLVRESLKKFGSINNFCKTTRQPRQAFTKFNDGNGVTRETAEVIFDALEIPHWYDDFDKIVELIPEVISDWAAYDNYWVGRKKLVSYLKQRVSGNCRLLLLQGITGIGKTALAEKVADDIQTRFTKILRVNFDSDDSPREFASVANRWLEELGENLLLEERQPTVLLNRLINHLREEHILVIIDSLEELLTERVDSRGDFKDDWWTMFFEDFLNIKFSRSILVVTSEDTPTKIENLASHYPNIYHREILHGLIDDEQAALFAKYGLDIILESEDRAILMRIGKIYNGHPLTLRVLSGEVVESFASNARAFWGNVGEEIELVEQHLAEAEAGDILESANDDWKLHKLTRKIRIEVYRRRLDATFNRLKHQNADAYLLICVAAIYRRPVEESGWFQMLDVYTKRLRNEVYSKVQKLKVLEYLFDHSLVEEYINNNNRCFLGMHNLIRSVALEHRRNLFAGFDSGEQDKQISLENLPTDQEQKN